MKKLLSLIIAAAITITAIPTVSANEENYIILERDDYTIVFYGDTTRIYSEGIFSVYFPISVTKIGDRVSVDVTIHGIQFWDGFTLTDALLADLVEIGSIPSNVTSLYLEYHEITDLTPLAGLKNLNTVLLSGNRISDISPLKELKDLEVLWLSENQITDISPLSGLTQLTSLQLGDNQISDISPLSGLVNLGFGFGSLNLSDNLISDISPLSELTQLRSLNLSNNQISDITPLSKLGNLGADFGRLDLSNNQISDITPLEWLTKLSWSTPRTGLEGNLFDRAEIDALNATVRANRSRGVLTLGHVLGTEPYTINDALEILMYLAGMDSVINDCAMARYVATIVSEDSPGIADALEILMFLAGLESVLSE
jgi:hypothetical protein